MFARLPKVRRPLLPILALLSLASCGEAIYDTLDLMPAPALYSEAGFDPFPQDAEIEPDVGTTLFYATDRSPADSEVRQAYYTNERGVLLRTGTATVAIDPPLDTVEDLRRVTLAGDRDRRYRLSLSQVDEIGVMPFSMTDYVENATSPKARDAAGRAFAARINAQLSQSGNKDVFIYTHGYNIDFDYATLVSKELQHYLGYQGAFISYNWTATPNRFAYFRDQESASATRRNLRNLISFLSENTQAERIHLVGYSAGSRLVFEVAYQIALQPAPKPSLGQLVLISSDLDRAHFIQAIEDGLLETVEDLTLYQSQTDAALAVSRLVFGRARLGETTDGTDAPEAVRGHFAGLSNLHIIDVTDAEEAGRGNGHWYFQSSPWASSDLFISLLSARDPAERGLVRAPGEIAWTFPPDYPDRIRRIVAGG